MSLTLIFASLLLQIPPASVSEGIFSAVSKYLT